MLLLLRILSSLLLLVLCQRKSEAQFTFLSMPPEVVYVGVGETLRLNVTSKHTGNFTLFEGWYFNGLETLPVKYGNEDPVVPSGGKFNIEGQGSIAPTTTTLRDNGTQCESGFSGNEAVCTRIPDEFIDVSMTLNGVFTNELNNRESDAFKEMEAEVKRNSDAVFQGVPEYRGINVIGFSPGSIIVNFKIILVPHTSKSEINAIIEKAKTTGSFGSLSVVPTSFRVGFRSDINECNFENKCHPNATCMDNIGSYTCQCKIGFSGDGIVCTRIPDVFIDVSMTMNGVFTKELKNRESVAFKEKEAEIKRNSDAAFQGVPEYRGINVIGFSPGSITVNFQIILVAHTLKSKIDAVFEKAKTTGSFGSLSVVPDSFSVGVVLELSDINMAVNFDGFAGSLLVVTCSVKGPSLPTFQWKKGSTILSLSTRVKFETNNKVSKLFVRKMSKSDAGVYHCVASKGEDSINSTVSISVKLIPVVSVIPLSVSATEGGQINLTCVVSVGDEENIKITWHNSKSNTVVGQGRTLDLSNIPVDPGQSSYSAIYWCSATNTDGTGKSQNVTVQITSKDYNQFCPKEVSSGYTWERTPLLTTVLKPCPKGKEGTVSRLCNSVKSVPTWGEVNSANCRSSEVLKIRSQVEDLDSGFLTKSVSEIISLTQNVTDEEEELVEKDVEDLVFVLDKTKNKTLTQDDRENFIKSSSNIVNKKNEKAWKKVEDQDQLAKKLVNAVDVEAESLVLNSPQTNTTVKFNTPNIDIIGVRLDPAKAKPEQKDLDLRSDGVGVKIPETATTSLQLAIVVVYSSLNEILSEASVQENVDDSVDASSSVKIRSSVVSFKTVPKLNSSEPFKVVLRNNQTGFENPRRTCAFIEPSKKQSKWSSKGCILIEKESNEVNVTCECDHNTAYAILMDVAEVKLTKTERKSLEIISTVGCSLSLVGIVLTIFMHICFWKQVKSVRSKVLLSLCVAIGFADILAILEGVARNNATFCTAVAALLHFFVLSAFGWMLSEGILLYIMLVRVFDGVQGKHWKIFNLIGWGLPALIVAASLAATQADGYGTKSACWLSVGSKLLWAFVGPALLVILVNIIIYIMVIRTMMNSHKIKLENTVRKVRTGLKASMVLFPILGLTWVFGLMTFTRETLFFQYLFAIFNSAQGMLIFVFHCVMNKQMRDVVRNSTMWKSTDTSTVGKKSVEQPKYDTSAPPKKRLSVKYNQPKPSSSSRGYEFSGSLVEGMNEDGKLGETNL